MNVKSIGGYETKITFRLATAVTDDGEGGDASSTGNLVIPVVLTPVSGQGEAARVVEQQFPGSSAYQYVFYGWIFDRKNYTFPKALRRQRRPIGECELAVGKGRIECSIGAFPIEISARRIGEKFTAIWTAV
ncbi:MAG: hypothetical protein AAFV85_23050 [Cyanobacteria bacterium J06634_6]